MQLKKTLSGLALTITSVMLMGAGASAAKVSIPIIPNQTATDAYVDNLNQQLIDELNLTPPFPNSNGVGYYAADGSGQVKDVAQTFGGAIQVFKVDPRAISVCRISDITALSLSADYDRTAQNIDTNNSGAGISVGYNLSDANLTAPQQRYGINALIENIQGYRINDGTTNYNAVAWDWRAWPGSASPSSLPTKLSATWKDAATWDIVAFALLNNLTSNQNQTGFVSLDNFGAEAEFKSDNACVQDDADADGIPSKIECPADAEICPDTDADGVYDYMDTDSDGDGILDKLECPEVTANGCLDTDKDGTPNYLDTDSDGDGKSDKDEGSGDSDQDGIVNYLDSDDATVAGKGGLSNIKVPNTGYAIVATIIIPMAAGLLIYAYLHHRHSRVIKRGSER